METRLFDFFASQELLGDFTPAQKLKFKEACGQAVMENPDLDFDGLCSVCHIYYNFIRDFPDMTLGRLK